MQHCQTETAPPRRTSTHGLPVLRAHELEAIKATGYAAVVVVKIGNGIAFAVSADPNRHVRNLASKAKAETRVLCLAWAPDAALGRRVKAWVEASLTGSQIGTTGLLDVPDDYARSAVKIAASKIGLHLATTDEMLARGDVKHVQRKMKLGTFRAAT